MDGSWPWGGLKGATSFGIVMTIVAVLIIALGDKKKIPTISMKSIRQGIFDGLRPSILVKVMRPQTSLGRKQM